MSHGGVAESARQVSIETAEKLRRYPGEGPAVTPQRVICGSNWTEFGPNFGAGDRGRSKEIEGGRRRSKEIEGGRSNLTQLRRSSLD